MKSPRYFWVGRRIQSTDRYKAYLCLPQETEPPRKIRFHFLQEPIDCVDGWEWVKVKEVECVDYS